MAVACALSVLFILLLMFTCMCLWVDSCVCQCETITYGMLFVSIDIDALPLLVSFLLTLFLGIEVSDFSLSSVTQDISPGTLSRWGDKEPNPSRIIKYYSIRPSKIDI